jgi:1-acyl-sn-glycerol-3-phosphate acyltransferase
MGSSVLREQHDPPVRLRSPSARPENRPIIRLLQAADMCFSRIYHRLTVRAPQQLPRTGPAILVCNHVSGLDPLLIQSVCPRLITWMMAREWYHLPVLGWVFRTVEAIPVDRSGRDFAATRAALRRLEAGGVLGIFPEGRIETSDELLPFQTGVAMMAIKTGVPVYPAYLDGSQRGREIAAAVITPCTAAVAFGPPVLFDRSSTSRGALEAATEAIKSAIEQLRPAVRTAIRRPDAEKNLATVPMDAR